MRDDVEIDPDYQRSRWVAYLDLLGTSAFVESSSWIEVFEIYSEAIERFRGNAFDEHLIERITFSDSFILYTVDNSALSYRALDAFCRYFVVCLVHASIPVRGAMACGDFYADPGSSLYFGKALLEAYKLSESQDWIGFVLSETARRQLTVVGLPAEERLNYAIWKVPLKISGDFSAPERALPCFIMGHSPSRQNVAPTLRMIRTLKDQASKEAVRRKYENTIQFLESNIREFVG